MEPPVISAEVLARYAGDAASDVDGVTALAGDADVTHTDEAADIVVHVELAWGTPAVSVAPLQKPVHSSS